MRRLYLDLETFSPTPIQNGTWAYSEDAEILIFSYAIDDEPAKAWDLTLSKEMPKELKDRLDDPETLIIGHNIGNFDRVLLKQALDIVLPIERVHDTLVQAHAHGLPGSLDVLCDIMQVPFSKAKDKGGKKLIQLFCVPHKTRERATRQTHPLEFDRFLSYAKLDIEATRYIYSKMPTWNYPDAEHPLWCIDQRINWRGCAIDTDLIKAAIDTVDQEQDKLRNRTVELTDGDVSSATQRDVMLAHILEEYGVSLPDMQASTIEHRIEDPALPDALKELLRIRLRATTSSTAKYKKILKSVSSDGRLRGTLQWCGASRTGRDAGRILNPQNLPRPDMEADDIDFGISAIKYGVAPLWYDNVMRLSSNAIRGVIVAEPGNKLLVADLSNIEGRFAAWLAGETWKIQAFKDYDTIVGHDEKGKPIRKGHDLYKLGYARSFRINAEDVTKKQRDTVGKTLELSMQFGGGVGAFVTFALNFGIVLEDLVRDAWHTIPEDIRKEAVNFWEYAVTEKRTLGLEKEVFVTCDSLKRMWRLANPNIAGMWPKLEDAVCNAIETKDKIFIAGKLLSCVRSGSWLRIALPSGRSLSYPAPRVSDKGEISFMGMDQYTRKWSRIKTYGAKLFENAVQGGSRDIFMQGVVNAEEAGYPCVMRVHDEQISEVPDQDDFTVDELCKLMTTNIAWAEGLPLAAAGFSTYRYRKAD